MPFKSKKQEDYLRINEPEVYKRWKKRYDNGGLNKEAASEVSFTPTRQGIRVLDLEGGTTIQGNIPFMPNQDAYAAIEQEVYVDKDKRVYVRAWDREGTGGAGVGATMVGDNWSIDTMHGNGETNISGRFVKRFNKGGMNGCPMDGAVIKGGTKIKPDSYTHGKRKV